MSRIEKYYDQNRRAIASWQQALNYYNPEVLQMQPPGGGWTLGQVVEHLLVSSEQLFFKKAQSCLQGEVFNADKGLNFWGKLTFLMGGFPPVRVRTPAQYRHEPEQPASVEALQERLTHLQEQNAALLESLQQTSDFANKRGHPLFGYMNAWQWFAATGMHFRHHHRQRQRIERALQKQQAA
jgi:hypothetical protein